MDDYDTDNDQDDHDICMNEDPEVKEEAEDHEIGHVEEELVIIPVQEKWSKNVKGFSDKRGLKVIHFADCSEGVLCELCSKQLPSAAALEKHRKAKHSDISFACEECGKQTATIKDLRNHQRSHKICFCYKCGKNVSVQNFTRHLQNCKGEVEKEQCDKCDYSTTDSLKMNRHKHRKHPVPVPKPVREAPKCQYCGNTFTRKYYRDLHERNNCKKRKMQMGELSPLSREEAMQWHSSTNMTKKDFNIIMDLVCAKWGDAFVDNGAKVKCFSFY